MRHLICLILTAGAVLSGHPTASAQMQYTADGLPTSLEEAIRWRVNRGRFDAARENQARGTAYADIPTTSGPLAPHQSLTLAARRHSEDMAKNNTFQHGTVAGSAYYNPATQPQPWDRMSAEGYSWNQAAENIAAGYSGAEAVYVGWWKSAGHRANMYQGALREIGTGHFAVSTGYRNYYTMDLGSSGNRCFFTDTLFGDANTNGVYDAGEGVANVVVSLVVGTTVPDALDVSSAVGSFAVPLAAVPSGATVQVVLSNAATSAVTLSVPRDYHNYASVPLAAGERRVYGTFTRPTTTRNVGLRELAPSWPPTVSVRLAIGATQAGATLTWPSMAGLQYEVQWSTNLMLWSTLTHAQPGTGSNMTVWDAAPSRGPKRFYRLFIR